MALLMYFRRVRCLLMIQKCMIAWGDTLDVLYCIPLSTYKYRKRNWWVKLYFIVKITAIRLFKKAEVILLTIIDTCNHHNHVKCTFHSLFYFKIYIWPLVSVMLNYFPHRDIGKNVPHTTHDTQAQCTTTTLLYLCSFR